MPLFAALPKHSKENERDQACDGCFDHAHLTDGEEVQPDQSADELADGKTDHGGYPVKGQFNPPPAGKEEKSDSVHRGEQE